MSQIFAFLEIKSSNCIKSNQTLPFEHVFEQRTEEYGPTTPNFDQIPPIYFHREVVRGPTFKAQ